MKNPIVIHEDGESYVDRMTLAILLGRSPHTIRARCRPDRYHGGRPLYHVRMCEEQLANIGTRRWAIAA